MIICKKCKEDKELSDYYESNKATCKACIRAKVKLNKDVYDKTKKGVIRVIYKTQKRHQKLRGHGEMPYSKKELATWCNENGFDLYYEQWVESNYDTSLKPSVDRLDTFKGYSLDNIRLVTWGENRKAQHEDILNGKGTSGLRCKEVEKLDEEGRVLDSYVSLSSAQRDAGHSLEYPIKNKTPCKSGYYWRYKAH